MSRRPAKPKAALVAAPETPAAAPAAAAPDPATALPQVAQDTTGAAVAAAAPVDPKPALKPTPTPHKLTVKGPAKGRWRAGRHFTPEAVAIPTADLTEAEIEMLEADPELTLTWTSETPT